jgi:hypothetical protein
VCDDASVVDEIVMSEQHALGRSCCAGGVLNIEDVVAIYREIGDVDPIRDHPIPGLFAQVDDMFKRQYFSLNCLFENIAILRSRVFAAKEKGPDSGTLQDVSELQCSIGGVHINEHESSLRAAELEINPFGAIRRPHADAIAGLQPKPE